VSELLKIHLVELVFKKDRAKYEPEFYRAQWKMLGWYTLWRYHPEMFPVFKLWSVNPWEILDSLQ
jgi:hypothetical protein